MDCDSASCRLKAYSALPKVSGSRGLPIGLRCFIGVFHEVEGNTVQVAG
jgi:hypothetical protein